MSTLFDQLKRDSLLMAYASTGNPKFLKDMEAIPKMGFNDPVHLPQPLPEAPAIEFDVWNDLLMRDCIGGKLTKPVQTLLQGYVQTTLYPPKDDADKARLFDSLQGELKALLSAVKDEFGDL